MVRYCLRDHVVELRNTGTNVTRIEAVVPVYIVEMLIHSEIIALEEVVPKRYRRVILGVQRSAVTKVLRNVIIVAV